MSASAKPPRRRGTSPPTTEQVAHALLDAEVFGDREAARRAHVHYNTISNWRRDWGSSKLVVAEMKRLRKPLSKGWIDEARNARRMLVARTVALAAKSKNLTAVTNATRRLNEIVLAHEIVHEDPGAAADALDAEHHDADQREAAGEAQGPGGADGDEGSGDLGGGEG